MVDEMVTIIRCCKRAHITGRAKCCDNCDCDERREAARVYQAAYRKQQKEKRARLGKLSAVPDIPAEPDRPLIVQMTIPPPAPAGKSTTVKTQYPVGIIGENALAEITRIDGAAERNPLLVALIMRLAHEVDTGATDSSVSAAANAIKRLIDDLRRQAAPELPAGKREPSAQDRFWQDWEQAK